jgi:hypothetical protein
MSRLASLPVTMSWSDLSRVPSSAFNSIFDSLAFQSIVALLPLKSKRVASSLTAWLMALSISCLSISETMSKEGMRPIVSEAAERAIRVARRGCLWFQVPSRRARSTGVTPTGNLQTKGIYTLAVVMVSAMMPAAARA